MNSDISGPWRGVLDTGIVKAELAVRLAPNGDDGVAWLKTRARGEIAAPLVANAKQVSFEAPAFDIALVLSIDASGERLEGACRHAGIFFPVAFARGLPEPQVRRPRPQTPAAPFFYETRSVEFEAADGSRLVGTLTRPPNAAFCPAILFSTWFGRVDRDQSTAGHKPFAIWADEFTRRGFVTLRWDKRGVGESSGDFDEVTTADSTRDLARAIDFLRVQPGIDPSRVGLFGHSEGGHISADAAASDPLIAFCVLLTPTGVPEEETFDTEMFRAAEAVGGEPIYPEEQIRLARALAEVGRVAASGPDAAERARILLAREAAEGRLAADQVERRVSLVASKWRRFWWGYDHTASMRVLACPVLIVFAGRDLQTAPRYHAPNVRAALARNRRALIFEMSALNHFLQHAITGAPSEYSEIEHTLAPEVITTVCDWASREAG